MSYSDEHWMRLAIEAGRRARVWSSPNPAVGCVIVRHDAVLATGFTHPTGQAHAEIHALSQVADATGSTLFVTLEPCAHTGRTPPCTQALIDAGISRVVIACIDPDERVSGKGINQLRSAGIDVALGVCEAEAVEDLGGFFLRLKRGYGRVTVKMAMSADGRTAMASGESQWITGSLARQDVQRQRAASSAIITGIGTVLADDCSLTVRSDELGFEGVELERALYRPPTRVVLDSNGRTPKGARVLSGNAPSLVITAPGKQPIARASHRTARVMSGGLDLRGILSGLGAEGANEILIESGPLLAAAFLQEGLVDELLIYQAPLLLGSSARPLADIAFSELKDGIQLAYREVSRLGPDLRIIAAVLKEN